VFPNRGTSAFKVDLKEIPPNIGFTVFLFMFYCLGCLWLSFKGKLGSCQIAWIPDGSKRLKKTDLVLLRRKNSNPLQSMFFKIEIKWSLKVKLSKRAIIFRFVGIFECINKLAFFSNFEKKYCLTFYFHFTKLLILRIQIEYLWNYNNNNNNNNRWTQF